MKYNISTQDSDCITCKLSEQLPSEISIKRDGRVYIGNNKDITENLDKDSHDYYIFPYKIEGLEMKFPTLH